MLASSSAGSPGGQKNSNDGEVMFVEEGTTFSSVNGRLFTDDNYNVVVNRLDTEDDTMLESKLLQRKISKKKRKKSGKLIKQDFEDTLFIYPLYKISKALQSENIYPDMNIIQPSELANISYTLQSFGEEEFGVHSPVDQRVVTKLCAAYFRDVSIGGSLHNIFRTTLKFLGTRKIDVIAGDRALGIELMREIEAALASKGLLRRHRIYFQSVPDKIYMKLVKIVKSHGAELLSTATNATHIVCWDEEVDNLAEELQEEFIRTIDYRYEQSGGVAKVHWWYHPDSYDEWIPAVDVDAFEPPDVIPDIAALFDKQWNVCCRFVLDCGKFNEWGNEVDYENFVEGTEGADDPSFAETVSHKNDSSSNNNDDPDRMDAIEDDLADEGIAASSSSPVHTVKRRGRRKTKGVSNADLFVKLRRETPIPEAVIGLEKMMVDLRAPTVDPRRSSVAVVLLDPRCNTFFIDETPGKTDTDDNNDIEASDNNGGDNNEALSTRKRKNSIKMSGNGEGTDNLINAPEWYRPDSLDAVETAFLDSICKESVSDYMRSEYITIRNYIMALYPQVSRNGSTYLSATECRRKISGDVTFIYKIHAFMDAHKLINYLVRSEQMLQGTPYRSSQLDIPVLASAGVVHIDALGFNSTRALARLEPFSTNTNPYSNYIAAADSEDGSGYEAIAWSDDLDDLLLSQVYKYDIEVDWKKVSQCIYEFTNDPNFTADACLRRFVEIPLCITSDGGYYNYKLLKSPPYLSAALLSARHGDSLRLISALASRNAEHIYPKIDLCALASSAAAAAIAARPATTYHPRESSIATAAASAAAERISTFEQLQARIDLLVRVDQQLEREGDRIRLEKGFWTRRRNELNAAPLQAMEE